MEMPAKLLRATVKKRNTTLRIDELLLWEGLVSEEQVKQALEYQRQHGGRLGSHLVRLGFVDEAGLLKALSKQYDCESVKLNAVNLPQEIIKMIPSNVAVARTVIPFDYDPDNNVLKVACEDPSDQALIDELNFVAAGKKVKLYVAAEMYLRAAVAKHYMSDSQRIAVESGLNDDGGMKPDETGQIETMPPRGTILVVSDEQDGDLPLRQALEQEGYRLVLTESADDAIEIIGKQQFHTVYIRDSVQGDYIDLIDRLRKVSPRTIVRYFESPGQLLINPEENLVVSDLIQKNLELFTSLLNSKENRKENHAGVVGRYVDRLCQQMGIPEKDRLVITNAAYLHDVSRFYYGEAQQAKDCRSRIQLTAKLLDSLNYSPLVTEILRSMYINLRQKYTKRLPIETLGGNIVTIVDIFCDNVSFDEKISLDKFEAIRNNLTSLSGKLFLPEVVEAFVEMIESEILIEPISEKYNQALMYCEDLELLDRFAKRLRDEGFRPVALSSMDRFLDLFRRSVPDMIILLNEGRASKAISLIDELIRRGIEIIKVPTFLLTGQETTAELTSLFERGIEDIIPIENSLDLLVVKMRKLRARAENKADGKDDEVAGSSTAGNLADMNLIDLLQALGPSAKTAKIKLTSGDEELVLFLDRGHIMYAECAGKSGAEAVYAALGWSSGKWVIQPVAESDLPQPNNELPNESILMEGCRLLDEQRRTNVPQE